MRVLSPTAHTSVNSQDGAGEVFLTLLKLEPSSGDPFYLVNNTESLTGTSTDVYKPYPFQVILPDETDAQLSEVSITIDNVDQLLLFTIRNEIEPIKVTLSVVLASTMDDINPEIQINDLELQGVSFDALAITGKLTVESIVAQKFPSNAGTYDSLQFKSLTT